MTLPNLRPGAASSARVAPIVHLGTRPLPTHIREHVERPIESLPLIGEIFPHGHRAAGWLVTNDCAADGLLMDLLCAETLERYANVTGLAMHAEDRYDNANCRRASRAGLLQIVYERDIDDVLDSFTGHVNKDVERSASLWALNDLAAEPLTRLEHEVGHLTIIRGFTASFAAHVQQIGKRAIEANNERVLEKHGLEPGDERELWRRCQDVWV